MAQTRKHEEAHLQGALYFLDKLMKQLLENRLVLANKLAQITNTKGKDKNNG